MREREKNNKYERNYIENNVNKINNNDGMTGRDREERTY